MQRNMKDQKYTILKKDHGFWFGTTQVRKLTNFNFTLKNSHNFYNKDKEIWTYLIK